MINKSYHLNIQMSSYKINEIQKTEIVRTLQSSFLDVVGKDYEVCYWQALVTQEVLSRLDPGEGKYFTKWALTWFVTDRSPLDVPEGKTAVWDFEDRYNWEVKRKYRLPGWLTCQQRMAHAFVTDKDVNIIDISSYCHAEVLGKELRINWEYKDQYIWSPLESLDENLRYWYRVAEHVEDEEYQAPPEGQTRRVADEAMKRLALVGIV